MNDARAGGIVAGREFAVDGSSLAGSSRSTRRASTSVVAFVPAPG